MLLMKTRNVEVGPVTATYSSESSPEKQPLVRADVTFTQALVETMTDFVNRSPGTPLSVIPQGAEQSLVISMLATGADGEPGNVVITFAEHDFANVVRAVIRHKIASGAMFAGVMAGMAETDPNSRHGCGLFETAR